MAKIEGLLYAGSFGVDSGQAMVGDPCYLKDWDNNDNDSWDPQSRYGDYSYQGACGVTLKDNYGELGVANAVVFSTGYGDGVYPVYVKLNNDGRVSMVIIDFEGEYDED